jgi:hypothetical protein
MTQAAFADVGQAHRDADGVGGLAFAERGGADGGDVDVLAFGLVLEALEDAELDLCLDVAVKVKVGALNAVARGDLFNGFNVRFACDLKVGLHRIASRCRGTGSLSATAALSTKVEGRVIALAAGGPPAWLAGS